MPIDTHKAYEDLTGAGADSRLAEAIIRLHRQADEHLATKQDLEHLAAKQDLAAVKQDVESLRKDMKHNLALLEQKLLTAMNRRAIALLLGILGGMWGLLELYL